MADTAPETDDTAPTADTGGASDVDLLDPTHSLVAARAAYFKGGTDVLVLRVGEVLAITDFFVIVSASNPRLVRSIVQEIEFALAQAGGPRPLRTEGLDACEWVLADYGTFVVHVFKDDARQYYELERLWSDVPVVPWEDEGSTAPVADPAG